MTIIRKLVGSITARASWTLETFYPQLRICAIAISLSVLPPLMMSPIGPDARSLFSSSKASHAMSEEHALVAAVTDARTAQHERATTPSPPRSGAAPTIATALEPQPFSLVWPARGPISQYMGPWHPKGIDIGLGYTDDRPIFAAADGVVVFAGGERCCGYGLYVIIEHRDGFSTLYSHFDYVDVHEGQVVSRGQYIGWGGSTGLSTGPHLHFELIHGGETYIDPIPFLPPHVLPPELLENDS